MGLAIILTTLGLWAGSVLSSPAFNIILFHNLPIEAQNTLQLIKAGGPFPYWQDDTIFGNFEKCLPIQPHGYYHEYTVPTPGASDRGKRRIVAGRAEYYYTADHYNTFWLIQ